MLHFKEANGYDLLSFLTGWKAPILGDVFVKVVASWWAGIPTSTYSDNRNQFKHVKHGTLKQHTCIYNTVYVFF